MKKTIIKARCISPGVAEGEALVSKSRISFWGGADVMKGIFTEEDMSWKIAPLRIRFWCFSPRKVLPEPAVC